MLSESLISAGYLKKEWHGKQTKTKQKPTTQKIEKREWNLDISNSLSFPHFRVQNALGHYYSGMCKEAKHRWKTDTLWRGWKQGKCSDPGQRAQCIQESVIHSAVKWSRPRFVLCCLQAWVVVHKTHGSRINFTSSLAQSAGNCSTCVALPLSRLIQGLNSSSEHPLWIAVFLKEN